MAISSNKNHYIYMVFDKEKLKFYIGKRTTSRDIKLDIDYIGSGNIISNIKKKYKKNKKYLRDRFDKVILQISNSYDENAENEKKWCDFFDVCNSDYFYNIHCGGKGGNTLKGFSSEQRRAFCEKISLSKKGVMAGSKNPMYGIRLTGEKNPMYGRHNFWGRHTKESIEKMKKPKSEEHKLKISKTHLSKGKNHHNYGTRHTYEWKLMVSEKLKGGKNPRAKKVMLINTGEIFECAKHASIKYSFDHSSICKCCNNRLGSTGKIDGEKCYWRYVD